MMTFLLGLVLGTVLMAIRRKFEISAAENRSYTQGYIAGSEARSYEAPHLRAR